MSATALIPLGNLYRMLCWGWRYPDAAHLDVGELATYDRIDDFFGALIAAAVRGVLRRGLARGYRESEEDLRAPRGKLLVSQTVKRQLRIRGRVHCAVEDLVADIAPNRILKAALNRLEHRVAPELRGAIRTVKAAFHEVRDTPLAPALFRTLQVSPGQRYYAHALDLCELLARWSLPTGERRGEYALPDPRLNEREMGWVFERFVRELYRANAGAAKVLDKRQIRWALVGETDEADALLPVMNTDIRLRDAEGLTVVETKFSAEALATGAYGKRTFKSEHLYQLHAYVTHLQREAPVRRAVLLTGSPRGAFAHRYTMDGVEWLVVSVDLAGEWAAILTGALVASQL